jgi:hypothetical protein
MAKNEKKEPKAYEAKETKGMKMLAKGAKKPAAKAKAKAPNFKKS